MKPTERTPSERDLPECWRLTDEDYAPFDGLNNPGEPELEAVRDRLFERVERERVQPLVEALRTALDAPTGFPCKNPNCKSIICEALRDARALLAQVDPKEETRP